MDTLYFPYRILTDKDLQQAASFLKNGSIVAFPTETVYGLGVDLFQEDAIQRLFLLKKRPHNKSMTIHISDYSSDFLEKIVKDIPDDFFFLAKAFFPGPLTIVLKKQKNISDTISSDGTIAVRMPDHAVCKKFIDMCGKAIVGTSANFSGEGNMTSARDVYERFCGKIAAVIDGKDCSFGRASTVLSLVDSKPKILREGVITKEQIASVLKKEIF